MDTLSECTKRYEVVKGFRWKDRKGEFHAVENMTSSHLFYTVRMIWNHTVEERLKLKPYIKYTLPPFYSIEYRIQAVQNMLKELSNRKDLEQNWIDQLNYMLDQSDPTRRPETEWTAFKN